MTTYKLPYRRLRLNEIKPEGWVKEQLKVFSEGLLGNLDKIFEPIKNNAWLGGKGNDNASLPVWLGDFITLAFLLNDSDMQLRAKHYIKTISENAATHEWLMTKNADDSAVYALSEMLNTYILYYEATGSEAVEGAVSEALQKLDEYTNSQTLSGTSMYRWFEAIPSIIWLYERNNEKWLSVLCKKLESQGFDWLKFFNNGWAYEGLDNSDIPEALQTTAENNAFMLRCGAILSRIHKDDSIVKSVRSIVSGFESSYSNAAGAITGDSKLVKANSACGADLSTVSALMKSFEYLVETSTDTHYADRLEILAFNSFPAAFSSDFWAHQYTSQSNQVQCSKTGDHVYTTDRRDANTFGLFDNAASVVGGFARFASSTAFRSDSGFVLTSYTPCRYESTFDGKPVTIECISDYPFREKLTLKVTSSTPCVFSLELRIPEWVDDVKISTCGDVIIPIKGNYYRFEGAWSDTTEINLVLHSDFRLNRRPNDLCSITKGALIFSMPINEEKNYTGTNAYPYSSYELTPSSSWNYALSVGDKQTFSKQITFEEKPITSMPFSAVTPALEMYCYGKKIQWAIKKGTATPHPLPVLSSDKKEMLRFIPYGATNLRITEFPTIK